MKKAYSYIRFSSELQKESGSYSRQLEKTKKWIEENNYEFAIAGEDLGVSASKGDNLKENKGLGNFIYQVENGKIETPCLLIVEQLDRATRKNFRQGIELLQRLINLGVEVVSVQENKRYNQKTLDDPFAVIELIMTLNAGYTYTKNMGERSHQGWEIKKRSMSPTNILTTAVPSWLKVIGKEKDRRIEIIPERAKIVERIYDRFLEGCGTGHIAIQLNEEGIPTPSKWQDNKFIQKTRIKNNVGKLWSEKIVRRFLTHHAVYGAHIPYVKKGNKKIQQGEPIEPYYPPIITKEKFYKVQDEIRKRRRVHGPNTSRRNLFTGIVFCQGCGYSMIFNSGETHKLDEYGRQKFQYLKCKSATKGGECKMNPRKPFRYQQFEDAVLSILYIPILGSLYSTNTSEVYDKLSKQYDEKKSKFKLLEKSMDEHLSKNITFPTRLSVQYNDLEKELEELEERLNNTPQTDDDPYALADVIDELESGEKEPLENIPKNRIIVSNIIREWVKHIVINPVTKCFKITFWHGDNEQTNCFVHWDDKDELYPDGGYCLSGNVHGKPSKYNWDEPKENDYSINEYRNHLIFKLSGWGD